MSVEIKLGGRAFKVVDFVARTVLVDHYLMKWLRATTVDKCLPMADEPNAEYLLRVQACLMDSGFVPEMLGGYLLPGNMTEAQWTPGTAAQTAKFIKTLNTQEDREAVVALAMELSFGFFKQGIDLWKRFQNSSGSVSQETRTEAVAASQS